MKKIETILKYIDNQGVSTSEFERKAGLSNGYLSNTSKRGADVTQKILDKIKESLRDEYYNIFTSENKSEVITNNTEETMKECGRQFLEESVRNLTEASKIHAENYQINAKNIERLISLLESNSFRLSKNQPEIFGPEGQVPGNGFAPVADAEQSVEGKKKKQ